jgi:hypothetical protein
MIPDIDAVLKMLPFALIRASLCRITVHLAYELRDTLINVNSADPGFDRYGPKRLPRHADHPKDAAEVIRLAPLSDHDPTGT